MVGCGAFPGVGIAHLYESFQNRMVLCLVLEYLPNGTLVNTLRKSKRHSERKAPCLSEELTQDLIKPVAQVRTGNETFQISADCLATAILPHGWKHSKGLARKVC